MDPQGKDRQEAIDPPPPPVFEVVKVKFHLPVGVVTPAGVLLDVRILFEYKNSNGVWLSLTSTPISYNGDVAAGRNSFTINMSIPVNPIPAGPYRWTCTVFMANRPEEGFHYGTKVFNTSPTFPAVIYAEELEDMLLPPTI